MPRAFLPHARSLAAADFLILPFLAPRVVAASPFHDARADNAKKHKRPQKEEKVIAESRTRHSKRDAVNSRSVAIAAGTPKETSDAQATESTSRLRKSSKPCLLLSQQTSRPHTTSTSVLARRYADIYHITREQSASFSTASPRSARRRFEQQSSLPVPHGDAFDDVFPALTHENVNRPKRLPTRETLVFQTRRKRHLVRTMRQYQEFLVRYNRLSDHERIRYGRFRSLLRRLYALSRREDTIEATHNLEIRGLDHLELSRMFAALDRKIYDTFRRASHRITLDHSPATVRTAHELCEPTPALEEKEVQMYLRWHKLPKGYRDSEWHLVLLYILDQRPRDALRFVQVLAHNPLVATIRVEVLADALEHIAGLYVRQPDMFDREDREQFGRIFATIFIDRFGRYPVLCSQDLLYNVGRLATSDQLRRIYDILVEHSTFIGYDTSLHYANRFGEEGDHEYALRCLQDTIKSVNTDAGKAEVVSRQRFYWSCAVILRRSVKNGQNYHETTGIVAEFLRLGVKLDILLYNVIMHNAMEAGDFKTAFQVFNLLEDNGVEPDKYTFSIMLHGCTMLEDPIRFSDFAEHSAEKARELQDPWLATDYLYYLYAINNNSPRMQHTACLRAYTRFFSIEPLLPLLSTDATLAAQPAEQDLQGDSIKVKMEPPPAALYLMLQLEILKAALTGPRQVWSLLLHFHQLVLSNHHPVLTALSKNPIIWNAFLLAFCRKQQFSSASQLMRDMNDGYPGFAKPNVYSWNIFMQAFFKNRQSKAAERIYEIMQSKGVRPDKWTYGVLLRGFAKAEHAEKVADALQMVDSEQQLDQEVLTLLTRMHDQKRLVRRMEENRIEKEEEEVRKAEEEAKRKWELPDFQPMLSSSQFQRLEQAEVGKGMSTTSSKAEMVGMRFDGLRPARPAKAQSHDKNRRVLVRFSGPRKARKNLRYVRKVGASGRVRVRFLGHKKGKKVYEVIKSKGK